MKGARLLGQSLFAAFTILFVLPPAVHADELILKPSQLLRLGYRPVSAPKRVHELTAPPFKPHSLPWPVRFFDARHTIGNVMVQFQDYGDGAYFHGGDDLRVQSQAWVSAPVSGRVEAGHYGYTVQPDGSMRKYWRAWPSDGNRMYFEVAVVTPQGYRFEFHHIDENTLPTEIINALQTGGSVQAGEELGRIVEWPNSDTDDTIYNHTHYNIVAPDGTHLNPEYYSVLLPDRVLPQITAVFAVNAAGVGRPFGGGRLSERPEEFVVEANDRLGTNIYLHTPAFSELAFDDGEKVTWDFRQKLALPDGRFPPIWEFLRQTLSVGEGQTLFTEGNYDGRNFLLRLRVPADAHGQFRIEIGDSAGNVAVRQGELP